MSTHNMSSLRNKKKSQFWGMQILNRQMDFDHLLVCGQVIKFDNATTLIYLNKDKIFFFIWVLRPFQEYFTYIEPIVHRRWAKTEYPEKNHLTIRKQNLAFPHMTRARLEPQR